MTIEASIILGLIALLFLQQVFFMWQVHKLTNKLMSRDFAEYSYVAKPKPLPGFSVPLPNKDEYMSEAEVNRALSGFNSL